jgi:hypothetical protein
MPGFKEGSFQAHISYLDNSNFMTIFSNLIKTCGHEKNIFASHPECVSF